jgi:type I restriction enzyme S subunit
MTPQELKNSILQLAIQGRLVEQRPEEGTAEKLYQQIQAEKQALIKAGKLKKEKPMPEITEDDYQFDIPESWKWAYVGELFQHNTGKAQNASGSSEGTLRKFITTSNLYWNRFDFSKIKAMPFTDQELVRCTVKKGDLLVCEGGDCGRSAIWTYEEEVCIQNHVHRLRPFAPVSIEYYYYVFYLYKNSGRLKGRGVGIQGLSNEAIHKVI